MVLEPEKVIVGELSCAYCCVVYVPFDVPEVVYCCVVVAALTYVTVTDAMWPANEALTVTGPMPELERKLEAFPFAFVTASSGTRVAFVSLTLVKFTVAPAKGYPNSVTVAVMVV
jgi:hypothetical protein